MVDSAAIRDAGGPVPDSRLRLPDTRAPGPISGFGALCDQTRPCGSGLACVVDPSAGLLGFCSHECKKPSQRCSGAPSSTFAACLLTLRSGAHACVFLCKTAGRTPSTFPCPHELTCSPTANPPGSGQHVCVTPAKGSDGGTPADSGPPVVDGGAMSWPQIRLDGAAEVPPVTTTASGAAQVSLDAAETQITVRIAYRNLQGITAAHIHEGAVGNNGGILFPLVSGTFASPFVKTLTRADFKPSGPVQSFGDAIRALKSGTTYLNIHTLAHPAGELRGQIR